jgi:fatty-acyl-CoA synthase
LWLDAFSSREPVSTSLEHAIVKPNADELIKLVKARRGSAHAPKHIKFVSELPMTGVGKVDKKVLKAGFWTGRERMVG